MNHLKVKFSVDLNNPAQVAAFNAFCSAMGGEATGKQPEADAPKTEAPKKRTAAKPVETKPEMEQPDPAAANMTVVDAQTVDPNETEAADDLLGAGQEAEPEIKLEDVRAAADGKINPDKNKNFADNTTKLKAKLTEIGAKNISTLDPAKFADMMAFIKTLA